mmetsp:Transcript_5628/g.6362  ORF Transcript_5628/g.6362 Transcript_5628/m.6362 type:complete len:443 (-) Transcript_5628:63-1391(-)
MYHLSDLHWNINYAEGTNNNCGEIVCCKQGLKPPTKESEKAGKWGDYLCDANPMILDQIKHSFNQTGEPDLFMWTGDNPDHGIYKDPKISTNATVKITKLIETHSPDTTIFPIHGNHEFDPMNTQDFNLEVDPVIEIVANSWTNWLTKEAHDEYLNQTYYSMMAKDHPDSTEDLKKKMGKTRIIGYNSQNCYIYNFFLLGQTSDPGQELEWLEKLLRQMEQDGEIAIFIGHMSPGTSDCFSEISSRLRSLFDRFQHIIRLNLFGHTHQEEFEVIRSFEDGKPIGVNHLAASMTTFTEMNPSFRVITLDKETMLPIKMETHALNIAKANKNDDDAIFKLDHEMIEEYQMEDLSPSSFLKLADSLKSDEDQAIKYKVNMFSNGSRFRPEDGCDAHCRNLLSCKTRYSVYSDARKCLTWKDTLKDIWSIESYLFDWLNGNWVIKN